MKDGSGMCLEMKLLRDITEGRIKDKTYCGVEEKNTYAEWSCVIKPVSAALVAIRWRIQFKLCTIMHSVHTGRCPAYLADCVQTVASSSSRSGLRSATSSRFVTPRLRTKFGERAFSYAGPAAWNSLPADIRDETDSAAFRKLLKTHYFNMAFKSS